VRKYLHKSHPQWVACLASASQGGLRLAEDRRWQGVLRPVAAQEQRRSPRGAAWRLV